MLRFLKSIAADERGTTVLEYGFIMAMIFLGIVVSVRGVADENTGLWATVDSKITEGIDATKS